MKRNLEFYTICFIGGGGLYISGVAPLPFLIMGVLLAILLLIVFCPMKYRYILAAVLLITGFMYTGIRDDINGTILKFEGKPVTAEGIVIRTAGNNDLLMQVDRLAYRHMNTGYRGRLLVRTYETNNYVEGNRISVEGVIALPGDTGYANYLKGNGCRAVLKSSTGNIRIIKERGNPVRYFSGRAASWVRNVVDENFAGDTAPVVKGILLGGKEAGEEVKDRFSRIGISHLLAVSGLHVGIIAGMLIWTARKISLPPSVRFLLISAFLAFFCFVIGLTPSVIRASIMAAVVLFSGVVARKQDTLTSLAFAALLIHLGNPFVIYSISFQLSFLSCLGIILFYRSFRKAARFAGDYISATAAVTLSAQILLVPVLIKNFQSFVPVSVLANMAAVPLASVLLVSSLLFLGLKLFCIPLYIITARISDIIVRIMNMVANIMEGIPYGSIEIREISRWFFWGYYIIIAAIILSYNFYRSAHYSSIAGEVDSCE